MSCGYCEGVRRQLDMNFCQRCGRELSHIVVKPAGSIREWYAFFGGEELGVSLDKAEVIWNAAINSGEKCRAHCETLPCMIGLNRKCGKTPCMISK